MTSKVYIGLQDNDMSRYIVEAIEEDWREVVRIQGEIGDCQSMIIEKTQSVMSRLTSTQKGAKMANARHEKPGGSREKHQKIRDIWASGKYTSRDMCGAAGQQRNIRNRLGLRFAFRVKGSRVVHP